MGFNYDILRSRFNFKSNTFQKNENEGADALRLGGQFLRFFKKNKKYRGSLCFRAILKNGMIWKGQDLVAGYDFKKGKNQLDFIIF